MSDQRFPAGAAIIPSVSSRWPTLYQHPLMRLAVDLRIGLALEARGGWIRSSTYDERSLVVGVRLGGRAPLVLTGR